MSVTYSADQTVLVNGARTTFPRDNQNHSVAMIAGYDITGNVILGTFNDLGQLNVSATGTVTVGDVTIQATLANGQIFSLGEVLNPDLTTYSLFVQDPRAAYTGSSLNVNVTNAETGNFGLLNAGAVRINPATNEALLAVSAQLPASLGAKTSAASLSAVLATNQAPLPVTQSGTWTVALATETIMIGQVEIANGPNIAAVSAAGALKVDGSAVIQPVSGTITANAGTGNFTVVQKYPMQLGASSFNTATTFNNKNTYVTSFDFNLLTATVETAVLLINNPIASGKQLTLRRIIVLNDINNPAPFNIYVYVGATVTLNGTAATIANSYYGGGGAASAMTAFSGPTTSIAGIRILNHGINLEATAEYDFDGLACIAPASNIVITGLPSVSNMNIGITLFWSEI